MVQHIIGDLKQARARARCHKSPVQIPDGTELQPSYPATKGYQWRVTLDRAGQPCLCGGWNFWSCNHCFLFQLRQQALEPSALELIFTRYLTRYECFARLLRKRWSVVSRCYRGSRSILRYYRGIIYDAPGRGKRGGARTVAV